MSDGQTNMDDAHAKMAAMGDARTKIEILYKIITGDITSLLDRIEEVDSRVPVIGESIHREAVRLENVLTQLQQSLVEYGKKINAENAKSISQLKEAAQQDMTDYADKLSGDLVKDIGELAGEIEESIGILKTAAGESSTSLGNATAALNDAISKIKALSKAANPSWESKRKDFLWIGAAAGLVGGLVAAVIVSVVVYMGKPSAPSNPGPNQAQFQR
jgi:hypothetical protein